MSLEASDLSRTSSFQAKIINSCLMNIVENADAPRLGYPASKFGVYREWEQLAFDPTQLLVMFNPLHPD